MVSNPFFSGRISQELLDAIEKHRQESGESKTDVLTRALSAYVNMPTKVQINNVDNPRLELLEKRLAMVEQLLARLQTTPITPEEQAKEKRPNETIPGQLSLKISKEANDNKTDNKIDNKLTKQEDISSDNEVDNSSDNSLTSGERMLTNREMSDLSGCKFETVRYKHKTNKPINHNGKEYIPIKENGWAKWKLT